MTLRKVESPTSQIIIDLSGIFPNIRSLFLMRDVFDGAISYVEASSLHTWRVTNHTIDDSLYVESKAKAVLRSKKEDILSMREKRVCECV